MTAERDLERLAEELRTTFLFESLTDEQLRWLAERGKEHCAEAGEVLGREGQLAEWFYVLLEGELQLTKQVASDEVVLVTSAQRGVYTGAVLAFMEGYDVYASTSRATRPSRFFKLPGKTYGEMVQTWFPMAAHLLAGMLVGVRNIEATVRGREKLLALGALSAGLAHELNNPAAAGRRAASSLRETVAALQASTDELVGLGLDTAAMDRLTKLRADSAAHARDHAPLDPIARGDREDDLGSWLDDRGVDDAWDLAPTLVGAGLDIVWAGRVQELLGDRGDDPVALATAVRWIADGLTVSALAGEVEDSTGRISTLVGAVRDYSQMDRAPRQETDVHEGLDSTLVMLGHKLEGIELVRDYDRGVPRFDAYASELNQVWTNLLVNAAEALHGIEGPRRITVRTAQDGDWALVEIADNGPGIPSEQQSRVFDAFYSTKDVGKGTGLGLDISRRIVADRHGGELLLRSEPGDTRFTARLPLHPPAPAAQAVEPEGAVASDTAPPAP